MRSRRYFYGAVTLKNCRPMSGLVRNGHRLRIRVSVTRGWNECKKQTSKEHRTRRCEGLFRKRSRESETTQTKEICCWAKEQCDVVFAGGVTVPRGGSRAEGCVRYHLFYEIFLAVRQITPSRLHSRTGPAQRNRLASGSPCRHAYCTT